MEEPEVRAHAEYANGPETFSYRLRRVEQEQKEARDSMKELSDRMDKLTLSVVGFALTLAVFGLGIAVTLLTARGGP